MGKRVKNALRPHEVEEEDAGIPGKLYFAKPKVIDIETYRKAEPPPVMQQQQTSSWSGDNNILLYKKSGPVRLKSTHVMAKAGYILPAEVTYDLTQRPPLADVHEYHKKWRTNGYGEGSIVARRYAAPWRARWHGMWGMIHRLVGAVDMNPSTPWAPYVVQWFDNVTTPEPAWAEDLVIIHTCLEKELLESILEAQGLETKELKT